jgi:hypothetical protein
MTSLCIGIDIGGKASLSLPGREEEKPGVKVGPLVTMKQSVAGLG